MSFRVKNEYYGIEVNDENVHIRAYHSKLKLLQQGSQQSVFACGPSTPAVGLDPLMSLILDIRGIEAVDLYLYRVVIRKSSMFEWDEIEAQIIELLKGVKTAFEPTFAQPRT
jgi:hypothetical protein